MIAKGRQNFLPTFILNLFLWLSWFYIIFFIPPEKHFAFILFFIALFLSLTLTLAFIFSSTRRGFLVSLLICGILLLRLIKQAHFLNLILLTAILGCLEYYFSKNG